MLEEENSAQPRERNAFAFFHDIFGTGNQHDRMRDFDPDSPEIKFSDRRAALELMTQIESTVTSLHREAEAQFGLSWRKSSAGLKQVFVARPCTPQKTLPVASMPPGG
ncbi:putative vimentin [Escherichia coli]|nr:putative vimentin [Escherichia coli]